MIVRHPRLPSVTRDVADVSPWLTQGWVADAATEPSTPEPIFVAPPKPRPRRRPK